MLPHSATSNFVTLADTYRDFSLEWPYLKGVTLAQWAMESGWGMTRLAKTYGNYAGMKWGSIDQHFGAPIIYSGGTKYTAFTSPTMFIEGYWNRVLNASPYAGVRDNMKSAEEFITYLTPPWLTGRTGHNDLSSAERKYVRDIMDIRNRRTEELFKGDHLDA